MFPGYLVDLFTLAQEVPRPRVGPVDSRATFLGAPFHAWLRRAEFLLGYGEVRRILTLQKEMMKAMEKSGQTGHYQACYMSSERRRIARKIEEQYPMSLGDAAWE